MAMGTGAAVGAASVPNAQSLVDLLACGAPSDAGPCLTCCRSHGGHMHARAAMTRLARRRQ